MCDVRSIRFLILARADAHLIHRRGCRSERPKLIAASLLKRAFTPQFWCHQLLGRIPITLRGESVERRVTKHNVRTRLHRGFGLFRSD